MSSGDIIIDFREIPGFPGYRISSDGCLQSCLKIGGRVFVATDQWRSIAGWTDNMGYQRVGSRARNRSRPVYKRIHELVFLAYIGPSPDRCEACHGDGDRQNNVLSNLRWDTRKGNLADCLKHGTRRIGSKSYRAKLTKENVIAAAKRVANGEARKKIADEYGVAYSTLVNAINGSKWKHVAAPSLGMAKPG